MVLRCFKFVCSKQLCPALARCKTPTNNLQHWHHKCLVRHPLFVRCKTWISVLLKSRQSHPIEGQKRQSLDRSKQLPALLSVECSVYQTLAWRSSAENASLFWALPLHSCYDHRAPSPMWGLLASSTVGLFFFCQPSLTPGGVLSLTHIQWLAFSAVSWKAFVKMFLFFGQSPATLIHFVMLVGDESSAANFHWEMHCFPPHLLTFSNKSLIVIVFPLMHQTDTVFMRHRELHHVHLFLFLIPYHQVLLFRCWDGEESLAALQICSYLPFNITSAYHGFVCFLSVRNLASLCYKLDLDYLYR